MKAAISCLLGAGLLCGPILAIAKPRTYVLPDNEQIEGVLSPGPGMELAQSNCSACHSLDYIRTQPPGKGDAFWGATVKKMVKTYGAPVEDGDAAIITAYLAKNY